MSSIFDPAAEPPPPTLDHAPEPDSARPLQKERRSGGGGGAIVLTLLLSAALGGGIYYTWTHPKPQEADPALESLQQRVEAEETAASQASKNAQVLGRRADALEQAVQALTGRVDALEKQAANPPPPPPAPDLGDLPKRVDDLTAQVEALASRPEPAPPPVPSGGHVGGDQLRQFTASLSQRLDQALAAQRAQAQQNAQQAAAAKAQAEQADQALAAQKAELDRVTAALKQTQDQLAADHEAAQQHEQQAMAALTQRLAKLEQGTGSAETAAARATRLARVQAAVVALGAGQKLGDIPNAPAAIARFAKQAPPTEIALREAFPSVAAHAREASVPDESQQSFFQRSLARLQQSVVVRQGDQVIVGDPAAGILAAAQAKVAVGDLQGAVTVLSRLKGPAADAVQGWVDQAKSLIEARAALAAMAAQG